MSVTAYVDFEEFEVLDFGQSCQSIGWSAMRPTAFNWNHALGLQNFYFYCDNFSRNLHENGETEILQILILITPHPGLDNLQLQAQDLVSDITPFAFVEPVAVLSLDRIAFLGWYGDWGILEWNPVPFPIPSRSRIPSRYRFSRDTGWGLISTEINQRCSKLYAVLLTKSFQRCLGRRIVLE